MTLRHIAGMSTATEQRCIRCCEIIARKGASSQGPSWPGAAVIVIGDRVFSGHVAATADDCEAVDLNERPPGGAPDSVEEQVEAVE